MKLVAHAVLLASLAVPGLALAASADDGSLACRGEVTNVREYSRRLGADADALRSAVGATSTQRVAVAPAQMAVKVDGGVVMVKPRGALKPAARSDGGWYALTDVSVSGQAVRGVAPYGERAVLTLDRRTGAVTFGGFAGACAGT